MGKVTITLATASSIVMLVAFGKGIGVLRGADPTSHFYWAMASLLCVLATNFIAMVHAAQSDRIIRELRRTLAAGAATGPVLSESEART
jgi:hypothetical protein